MSQPYAPMPAENPAGKKATQALILSIVGLLCCPLIFSIIALVFANQATRQGAIGGRAQAARVIAVIGLVLWALGAAYRLTR